MRIIFLTAINFTLNITHLLGEAHNLQPVALPDWSVCASVDQLIHLFHRLDCGDLGRKRCKSSRHFSQTDFDG